MRFHILAPVLRHVFPGAAERSLRAVAQRLVRRTVLPATTLLYDDSGGDGGGDGEGASPRGNQEGHGQDTNGGADAGAGVGAGVGTGVGAGMGRYKVATFAILTQGDMLVAVPTAAATSATSASATSASATSATSASAASAASSDRILGVTAPGNAFSYIGAEALMAALDPADAALVIRSLTRRWAPGPGGAAGGAGGVGGRAL